MNQTLTFEGFLDLGGDKYEDTVAILVKPVLMQVDDVSSGAVAGIVEDLIIDMAIGRQPQDDPSLVANKPNVMNAFYRIRQAQRHDARFVYFKRVVQVYQEPDPRADTEVYRVLEAIGDL